MEEGGGDEERQTEAETRSFTIGGLLARSNQAGRWTLGLIILLGVVFIWVFSGVLMQVGATFNFIFFLMHH